MLRCYLLTGPLRILLVFRVVFVTITLKRDVDECDDENEK